MLLRKLFFMTTIIVVHALCYANSPFLWQDKGIPVRKGSYVEWTRQFVTIDDDRAVVVWSDARNANRELWTQAINSDGTAWNNGNSILVASSDNANESPALTATSDGNAIVAWVDYDYRTETGSIYAQKISADGELMWGDRVLISRDNVRGSSKEQNNNEEHRCPYYPYTMNFLEIVPNNEGGAYIFWYDTRNEAPSEIYGMHLNSEGQPYSEEWIEGGILFSSGEGSKKYPNIYPDGSNGIILAYIVYRGRDDTSGFVKRVLADGSIEWENGLPITEDDYLYEISVAPFGENAFGLAVRYSRNRYVKIDAHVISGEGEFLWEEGLPVDIETPEGYINLINSRGVNTADGGFAITWKGDYNLYAQKFNIEGERLWGDKGMQLADPSRTHSNRYEVICDNDGGIIVAWGNYHSNGYRGKDVYAQHITSDGELNWENEKPFVETDNRSFGPAIRFIGDNLFLAWGESGDNFTGIHVQGYDNDYEPIFADSGELIYKGLDSVAGGHKAL